MRTVRLTWRPRISKKKRAIMMKATKQYYPTAKDKGDYLELKAPRNDTKYIWLFMLTKLFNNIQ